MKKKNTQPENGSEGKRDSNRVMVNFPLSYSMLTDEEYNSIKDSYCAHTTSDREGQPTPFEDNIAISLMERDMEESLGNGFVQMWRLIDHKLNMIYSALKKDSQGEGDRGATCVELGSTGLKMTEKVDVLKSKDRLKLLVSPLTYPPFSIAVLGSVHRTEKKEDGSGGIFYESAVTFDVINKDDQERLITYIFKRQREIIRSGNK